MESRKTKALKCLWFPLVWAKKFYVTLNWVEKSTNYKFPLSPFFKKSTNHIHKTISFKTHLSIALFSSVHPKPLTSRSPYIYYTEALYIYMYTNKLTHSSFIISIRESIKSISQTFTQKKCIIVDNVIDMNMNEKLLHVTIDKHCYRKWETKINWKYITLISCFLFYLLQWSNNK